MIAICYLLSGTLYLLLALWFFLYETSYYLQKLVSFARCRNFFFTFSSVVYFFKQGMPWGIPFQNPSVILKPPVGHSGFCTPLCFFYESSFSWLVWLQYPLYLSLDTSWIKKIIHNSVPLGGGRSNWPLHQADMMITPKCMYMKIIDFSIILKTKISVGYVMICCHPPVR